MSRIGKNPVAIPDGVEIQINGQDLKAKGKLGELSLSVHEEVAIELAEVANDDGKTAKVVKLSPKMIHALPVRSGRPCVRWLTILLSA